MLEERGSARQQAVAESPWACASHLQDQWLPAGPCTHAPSHYSTDSYSTGVYFHSSCCNWPRLLCQEPLGRTCCCCSAQLPGRAQPRGPAARSRRRHNPASVLILGFLWEEQPRPPRGALPLLACLSPSQIAHKNLKPCKRCIVGTMTIAEPFPPPS